MADDDERRAERDAEAPQATQAREEQRADEDANGDDGARMRSPMRDENRSGERSDASAERMSEDEMREHNRRVDSEQDDRERADQPRGEDLGHAERSMPPDDPERSRREQSNGRDALLADYQSEGFQARWVEIQGRFVDDPRAAVEDADELVDEVLKCITSTFSDERGRLESQWSEGGDIGTEELRVALQRYRSFFQRLLVT